MDNVIFEEFKKKICSYGFVAQLHFKHCIFLFLIKKIKISVWILFLSMSYIQYVPKVERITFTFVQNSSLCLCIQILQSEKVQSIVYQR